MRFLKKLSLATLSISLYSVVAPVHATLCFDVHYDKPCETTKGKSPSVSLTISKEIRPDEKIFGVTYLLPENEDGTLFGGLHLTDLYGEKDPRTGNLTIDSFTEEGLHKWAVLINGQESVVSADRFGWLHVHKLDLGGSYKLSSLGAIHFAGHHTQSKTLFLDGAFFLSGTLHADELTISERTPSAQWSALSGLTIERLAPPEDFCYKEKEFRKRSHMNARQHALKIHDPLTKRYHHGTLNISPPQPRSQYMMILGGRHIYLGNFGLDFSHFEIFSLEKLERILTTMRSILLSQPHPNVTNEGSSHRGLIRRDHALVSPLLNLSHTPQGAFEAIERLCGYRGATYLRAWRQLFRKTDHPSVILILAERLHQFMRSAENFEVFFAKILHQKKVMAIQPAPTIEEISNQAPSNQ
jgi:hypothetical protein